MNKKKRSRRDAILFYGKFAGMALEMFVTLLLFALLGRYLDRRLALDGPYLTALLVLIALAVVMYRIIRKL